MTTTEFTYRTAAEVAKVIRAEIKAAVAAGELPAVKYRVRSDRFAGGQAVDIHMEMDDARAWVPTAPTDIEFLQYRMDVKLSDEVRAAGKKLSEIGRPHRSAHFYVMAYLNGGTVI